MRSMIWSGVRVQVKGRASSFQRLIRYPGLGGSGPGRSAGACPAALAGAAFSWRTTRLTRRKRHQPCPWPGRDKPGTGSGECPARGETCSSMWRGLRPPASPYQEPGWSQLEGCQPCGCFVLLSAGRPEADRDGAVDGDGAGSGVDVDPDQAVRRGDCAGKLSEVPRPGRDLDGGVAGLGRGDAEDVPDEVLDGGGAPGVDGGAPAPALAERTAPRSRRSPSRAAGRPPLRWSTATSAPPTAGTSTPTSGCSRPDSPVAARRRGLTCAHWRRSSLVSVGA